PYYDHRIMIHDSIVEANTFDPSNPISVPGFVAKSHATLEPLYLFHMNDASTHPNGEVVTASLGDSSTLYRISLSGEPSGGVMGYYLIHCDTNVASQQFGF